LDIVIVLWEYSIAGRGNLMLFRSGKMSLFASIAEI
jgi:hypothetical protein